MGAGWADKRISGGGWGSVWLWTLSLRAVVLRVCVFVCGGEVGSWEGAGQTRESREEEAWLHISLDVSDSCHGAVLCHGTRL